VMLGSSAVFRVRHFPLSTLDGAAAGADACAHAAGRLAQCRGEESVCQGPRCDGGGR